MITISIVALMADYLQAYSLVNTGNLAIETAGYYSKGQQNKKSSCK